MYDFENMSFKGPHKVILTESMLIDVWKGICRYKCMNAHFRCIHLYIIKCTLLFIHC